MTAKAYLCGRRKIGFAEGPRGEGREVESLMLESERRPDLAETGSFSGDRRR